MVRLQIPPLQPIQLQTPQQVLTQLKTLQHLLLLLLRIPVHQLVNIVMGHFALRTVSALVESATLRLRNRTAAIVHPETTSVTLIHAPLTHSATAINARVIIAHLQDITGLKSLHVPLASIIPIPIHYVTVVNAMQIVIAKAKTVQVAIVNGVVAPLSMTEVAT